jgi:hypothetical protein
MQPHDRPDDPDRSPYPVKSERDRQLRQRQRRAESPARLLPQPPDHRPVLPGGQPWQQANRDPTGAALNPAV